MVIVVYTHTDVKDVWVPFFDRLKKYMSDYKTYICVDKDDKDIPTEYHKIYYNTELKYTERLSESLSQINEEVILFMHEDMILYNTPNHDYIKKYADYIESKSIDSVKLIYLGDGGIESPIDSTLVLNEYSKFSIQPTIIRKSILEDMVKGVGAISIWEFELAIVGAGMDFMPKFGNEIRRGLHHCDSSVYPYIATAINKGKWNTTEYQKELDIIFEEYNINPFERGIW
jgi:hypothetical protein